MKFRVRKSDHGNVIEFDANYFSDNVLNSLENINGEHSETVKVALLLSLDDLKGEPYNDLFITDSIDDIISRLQEFTRPVKNDGAIMPRKIMVVIEYYNKKKRSCERYLKSLTCSKINESLVDLELEFIGH